MLLSEAMYTVSIALMGFACCWTRRKPPYSSSELFARLAKLFARAWHDCLAQPDIMQLNADEMQGLVP